MAGPQTFSIAAISSGGLILEHLGRPDEAEDLQRAIEQVAAQGILTRDVGGTATTDEVTSAIIAALGSREDDRA